MESTTSSSDDVLVMVGLKKESEKERCCRCRCRFWRVALTLRVFFFKVNYLSFKFSPGV